MCRQLKENPDVEGNQKEIKKHKNELMQWNANLEQELKEHLKFENFANNIQRDLLGQ